MSERFPPFPDRVVPLERFAEEPSVEEIGDLDELLEAAERNRVLDEPAHQPEAALGGKANTVRAPVIAENLFLLGYLADKSDDGLSTDPAARGRFLSAVERFQRDANLKPDRWVGEKTWWALRRLVTFETDTHMTDFLRDGTAGPALARAVRLRLFALGVLTRGPGEGPAYDRLPLAALGRFRELTRYLGFADEERPDPLTLIERVFDHDRIVAGIADSPRVEDDTEGRIEGFEIDTATMPQSTLELLQRFLVSVAKVELWLLGFDVDIDRRLDYPVLGIRKGTPRNKGLRGELRRFWRELAGRPEEWSKKLVRFITPALFQAFARIEAADAVTAEQPDGDESREVLERVGNRPRPIEEHWAAGRALGMRLWDGLKRIWRWIVRRVRRILEIGRNLARAFFVYATKAFRIARFTLRTTAKALGQYLDARIRTGDDNPVEVALAGDGDIRVRIPSAADTDDVEQAARMVGYFGTAFSFATRLLSAVVRAIRAAAGALVANVVGWARLVWVLVESYRELRPVWRELRAVPEPAGW